MSDQNTVLVVEDNDFVRMQIAKYLTDAGYAIVEASTAEDALGFVFDRARSVGLAIVDVRMEPMGGFDFIRAIRAENSMIPVVLVTGDQAPDVLEQAGKLGVSAVLMKPVERERLVRTVVRTLGGQKRA